MSDTRAVILAAGIGRRMGPVYDNLPKCLLRFDAVSLLVRQLNLLAVSGVERLTLVTGFEAAQIERALDALMPPAVPDMTVETLFNPEYHSGSVLSCLAAESALSSGDSVLLMDADVLCDARMITRLLTSPHANCVLVDRDLPPGDEPVKLAACDGRPVGFGKQMPVGLANFIVGESVGFFRLMPAMAAELARRCSAYQQAGKTWAPYEHPLCDLMLARSQAFGYEDVTGLPWIEIDFPEDVQRAQACVLPRLRDVLVTS